MRTVSSLQRPVQLLENSWRSIQAYRGLSQNRQNFTYQNISRRISRLSVIGLNASLSLQHSTTVPALHGLERRPAMEVIRVAKPGTSPGAGGHPVARGGHRRVACASRPLAPVCSSPALADPRRCLVHGPAELRARDWSPRRFGGQGRVRYWCTRRSDGAPGGGREAVGVPHFAPAIYAAPCAARACPPRRRRCSACEPATLARAAAVSAADRAPPPSRVGRARHARCLIRLVAIRAQEEAVPFPSPSPSSSTFPSLPSHPHRDHSVSRHFEDSDTALMLSSRTRSPPDSGLTVSARCLDTATMKASASSAGPQKGRLRPTHRGSTARRAGPEGRGCTSCQGMRARATAATPSQGLPRIADTGTGWLQSRSWHRRLSRLPLSCKSEGHQKQDLHSSWPPKIWPKPPPSSAGAATQEGAVLPALCAIRLVGGALRGGQLVYRPGRHMFGPQSRLEPSEVLRISDIREGTQRFFKKDVFNSKQTAATSIARVRILTARAIAAIRRLGGGFLRGCDSFYPAAKKEAESVEGGSCGR